MATSRDDFKHLQVPLAIGAILIAAGAAAVGGSYKWTELTKREFVQVQAARSEAQSHLAKAQEEEQEIKRNLLQYRQLASQGVVGDENRLDWIERLAQIKSSRKLYDIRYEISEQQKAGYTGLAGPDIMVSKMALNLPLLHEEDLFNLLGDLRAGTRGYFQVKSCSLVRTASQVDRRVLLPMLNGNCELDFYTIRESPAKPAGA
jgi:hypothetical protein